MSKSEKLIDTFKNLLEKTDERIEATKDRKDDLCIITAQCLFVKVVITDRGFIRIWDIVPEEEATFFTDAALAEKSLKALETSIPHKKFRIVTLEKALDIKRMAYEALIELTSQKDS